MAYQYDIFISYRRLGGVQSWIENYFVPLIEDHLSQELGRNPIIFIDSQIETGDSWPLILGNALSASRIIIPLWTTTYLKSLWCSSEIGHMLEREKKFGYRTNTKPNGLIFPIVICDGDTMPVQISTIQKIDMKGYYKNTLNKEGQLHAEFEDKVKQLVTKIAIALDDVPIWQQDWQIDAVNSFAQQLYNKEISVQNQPPKFSN